MYTNIIIFYIFLLHRTKLLFQCPEHGVSRLNERLLLFRHDYTYPNILQIINCPSDITDETLVEIVLSGKTSIPQSCRVRQIITELLCWEVFRPVSQSSEGPQLSLEILWQTTTKINWLWVTTVLRSTQARLAKAHKWRLEGVWQTNLYTW